MLVLVATGSAFVACSTPEAGGPTTGVPVPLDAPMESVLAETIDEYRPPGVTLDKKAEWPASELNRFNTQVWDFRAPDEQSLVSAAKDLHDRAVSEGWNSGGPFADNNGLFVTRLFKGPMKLTLRYQTAAYFPVVASDEDVLSLTAEMMYDERREEK